MSRKQMGKKNIKKRAKIKTEVKKFDEIGLAKYNPRIIDDNALKGLKHSMEQFGYVEPLVWNKKTNTLVAGHQRIKGLKDEGYIEADMVVVNLSKTQEKVLNITLNNPYIQGRFDWIKMNDLVVDIMSYEHFPRLSEDLLIEHLVTDMDVKLKKTGGVIESESDKNSKKLKRNVRKSVTFYFDTNEDYEKVIGYFAIEDSKMDTLKLMDLLK